MSCVKNVIQTADVFASALEHLSCGTTLDLIQQIMQLTEAANHETNVNLSTQITTVRNDLQVAINQVSIKTDQALAAAKILEGAEIDQLLQAFKNFIGTAGIQQLIQDSAVNICGVNYQLGSVLNTIATADREAKVELLHNPAGTELLGVRYTLTDGKVITLDAHVSEDGGSGLLVYRLSTDDWRGLPASFECIYRRLNHQLTFFGKMVSANKFIPVSHTNLVFDLGGKFKLEMPVSEGSLVPDLSHLGGSQPGSAAAAATAGGASASVSATVGSGIGAEVSAIASSTSSSASSSSSTSSMTTTTTTTTTSSSSGGS